MVYVIIGSNIILNNLSIAKLCKLCVCIESTTTYFLHS